MTPDVSGKDVGQRAPQERSDRLYLSTVTANNEAKAERLGLKVNPIILNLTALQVRVESLVKRTVGHDPLFELDYEQSLAAVLDDLLEQIDAD